MRADTTNRRRVRLSVVASAAALALAGTAATAAPAVAAEPPTPRIGAAITGSERGTFNVSVVTATGVGIESVSAKVRSDESTVVAEVPRLTETSRDSGDYGFPLGADPLKLVEDAGTMPALGAYAIDVTVTDALGRTTTRKDAGTLNFTLEPTITGLTFGTPAWDDLNARAQGNLVGIQPGSGDLVPLPGPGREVEITRVAPHGVHTASVDDQGRFAAVIPVSRQYSDFDVRFSEHSETVDGSVLSRGEPAPVATRAMTLTGDADKDRVLPGEKVTISGRALFDGVPAANTEVRVGFAQYGTPQPLGRQTVTTDADGRYSAVVPGVSSMGYNGWAVVPANPFVIGLATGPLALPNEVSLRSSVSMAGDGYVTANGSLRGTFRTDQWDSVPYGHQKVQLQHSADGRTWKAVKTGDVLVGRESWTPFQLRLKGLNGYYRVVAVTSDDFAGATGPVTRLSRTATRITGVNAVPEPIRKGAVITVTGALSEKSGATYRALPRQRVALVVKWKNSSKWSVAAWGTTDSKGRVSLRAKPSMDGTWTIQYTADATHFDSIGTGDFVDVR
ncbi:hypothetical protein ACIBCM_14010 [Streptomyces sp. NPDC051018]|uniref:hypothetical protein n=1 Tax=Streptomyces sp. NPDC051018 TaxID=3365639 RepID=UPI0037A02706